MTTIQPRTLVLRDGAGEPFGFLRLAAVAPDAQKGDCIFDITPGSAEQAERSEVRWLQKRGYRRYSEHRFLLDDDGVLTVSQGNFKIELAPTDDGGFGTRLPSPRVTAVWASRR